jgi:DNA-binding response OmpR family regulator
MIKPTVLLIDDDPVFLDYQSFLLKEIGFNVFSSVDSSNVRKMIKKCDPDLLILDKVMPIDGLLIAEQVKKEFEWLPVLIVTGTNDDIDKKKAFALGCIDYIRKDCDKDEFMHRISKYCHIGHLVKSVNTMSNNFSRRVDNLDKAMAHKRRYDDA